MANSSDLTFRAIIAALSALGVTEVELTYNGSGDEGYINEVTFTPNMDEAEPFISPLNDWGYGLLERHYGGWEINEGSHGTITIRLDDPSEIVIAHEEAEVTYTSNPTTLALTAELGVDEPEEPRV